VWWGGGEVGGGGNVPSQMHHQERATCRCHKPGVGWGILMCLEKCTRPLWRYDPVFEIECPEDANSVVFTLPRHLRR
jgi:hypothetical protein